MRFIRGNGAADTFLNDVQNFDLSGAAQQLLTSKSGTLGAYASALWSAGSHVMAALQSPNPIAFMNAAVGIVTSVVPAVGAFWAATQSVMQALPQAQSAADPCAGRYLHGSPGPDEIAHAWSSTGPLNPGDNRQAAPGSFPGWWAQQVAAAPNDPWGFFRALAGAQALEEGKFNNCYSDAMGGAPLLLAFISGWNTAHADGPLTTITRQIPNQDESSPAPGGGFPIRTPDHPPDEDGWTAVVLALYLAANHGFQPPAHQSPRETATLQVRAPAPHVVHLRPLPKGAPMSSTPAAATNATEPQIAVVYPYAYLAGSWTPTSGQWGDLGLVYAAVHAHPGVPVGHYAWDGAGMTWHEDQ
jgi:hypothetical protein